jgi:predicted nucleotide-binding protein
MPKLTRDYARTVFKIEVIQEAIALVDKINKDYFDKLPKEQEEDWERKHRLVSKTHSFTRENDSWRFDSMEEFFAEYRKGFSRARIDWPTESGSLEVIVSNNRFGCTTISLTFDTMSEVHRVMDIFERYAPESLLKEPDEPVIESPVKAPVVFIGHGGASEQWRDLKDHLHEQHKYDVEAYEVGSRAGHTIRDILEEMVRRSSFAIIVMTGEDKTAGGAFNPRLNVVHELGLFQGALGFSRAIVLLEEGTEEFSNIHGIQQIRFKKNNIRETYGDVLATLRREFQL